MFQRSGRFVLVLLAIEFLDELAFGARAAAWPLIRDELALDYVQIGLLLSLPDLAANVLEPVLGILADTWKRKALIVGGGVLFTLALFAVGASTGFALLLLAFVVFHPASGAFVSLSQATLMDLEPARHEQNMARWTVAGSLGVVAGPLLLGTVIEVGWGWRELFYLMAGLALVLVAVTWRQAFPPRHDIEKPADFLGGVRGAFQALRRSEVVRWLTLLQFSDLMLDVLLGFLALYFADVAGASPAQAGVAVAVWTGVGLAGDLLLIPLLERVRGLRYLRVSAALVLVIFPAFLLVPGWRAKLVLVGILGLLNAGWYAILKAQLYASMPGQSGTVLTVGSVFGWIGALIPLGIGAAADQWGLGPTLWLLLLGPLALLAGIPRRAAPSSMQR